MAESEEELKKLLMKVKEESGKDGLKLNITKKTQIVAFGPITSWQIEGEDVEAVTDFLSLGSKIIVDGNCSHEIKTIASWQENYGKPRQCVKRKDITLLTKVRLIRAIYMVFPVVTYSCDSWTIKKTECQRIDAFQLWCRRRRLSPWDSKEIKPVNSKGNQP